MSTLCTESTVRYLFFTFNKEQDTGWEEKSKLKLPDSKKSLE